MKPKKQCRWPLLGEVRENIDSIPIEIVDTEVDYHNFRVRNLFEYVCLPQFTEPLYDLNETRLILMALAGNLRNDT